MATEDADNGRRWASADFTAAALTRPLAPSSNAPDPVNSVKDGPVRLELCRTWAPEHQDRLDRCLLDALRPQDRSHGPGARPRTIQRSVTVTVRRPLAPGTDELGLDRQHSPWADSDVIDVVMLHRDVVHNRPAELPTGEHLPGERLPHSPSVTG